MKIAYTAGMVRYGFDGVTRVLYKWNETLLKNNTEHIFIAADVPPKNEQTVPMFQVPSIPFPLYKEYRVAIPTAKYFDAVLDEFKPDVIHFNSPCPLAFASLRYGRKHDIPVVATYHTHFLSYARYYKMTALTEACWSLYHKLYDNCAQVYVPSMPIMHELEQGNMKNLVFLPHGVDTTMFNPSYYNIEWKKKIGAENKFVALFAGRLVWEKDIRLVAEMNAILRKKYNDFVFVIAGDGPARAELQTLMPDAIFLGHLNAQQLATAYASSDVFVFPSRTETFGNVTVEAMACGTIPVCSATGGAVDLIEHGVSGFLVEPGNVNGFVSAVETVLNSPASSDTMAKRAYAFAATQSWEKIIQRMMNLYIVAGYQKSLGHAA